MSYDAELTTDLDKARALLGDTSNDATTELVTDEHIEAALGLWGFNGGVAFVATGLASRFAQKPSDVSLPSGLRVAWKERIGAWSALAAQMRAGGVSGPPAVAPYVGGISKTDKRAVEDEADRVPPAFTRDRDMVETDETERSYL